MAEVVLPATDPRVVATYETTAADEATVRWSWTGPDRNAFTVLDGVLAFASGPNYEHPTASEGTNTYHVTVAATAGTQTATVDVMVVVENADDPGVVPLSTLQPQLGHSITALLLDEDGGLRQVQFRWFLSGGDGTIDAEAAGDGMAVSEAEGPNGPSTTLTLSPTSYELVGRRLQVQAYYEDGHGPGKQAVSAYTEPVAAAPDQPGSISLSPDPPQVGQPITATLSDPDGRVSNLRWSWLYFSASGASEGSEEASGTGLASTFTPSSVLAGIRLRARVLYDDGHGTGKSAESDKTDPVTRPSSKPLAASLIMPPDAERAVRVAPNPFNPTTSLHVQLPASGPVWLTIYNVAGQVVRTIMAQSLEADYHIFHWDGHDQQGHPVTSGVYLYRVQTTKQVLVGKMALIR